MRKEDGASFHNCIFWGNTDNGSTTTTAAQLGPLGTETAIVTYSCIQDDDPNDSSIPFGGASNHNIDDNPLFVDPANGNYRLQPCSPAIDAADYDEVPPDFADVNENSNTSEKTPWDLDRQLRVYDVLERADTGNDSLGSVTYTDMGAFELHVPACELFGDLEVDASVDGLDIAPFVNCILGYRRIVPVRTSIAAGLRIMRTSPASSGFFCTARDASMTATSACGASRTATPTASTTPTTFITARAPTATQTASPTSARSTRKAPRRAGRTSAPRIARQT